MAGIRFDGLLVACALAAAALPASAAAQSVRTAALPADRHGEIVRGPEPVANLVFTLPPGRAWLTPLGVLWGGRHPAGVPRACSPAAVATAEALSGPIRHSRGEFYPGTLHRTIQTALITGAGLTAPRRVPADSLVGRARTTGALTSEFHVRLPGDLLPLYQRRDLYLLASEGKLDDSDPCSDKTRRLGESAVRATLRNVRIELPPTYAPPTDQVLPTTDLRDGGGLQLTGRRAREGAGDRVAAAGDVNGDGYQDALVTASYADGRRGAAFVVFGRSGGGVAALGSSAAAGFRIDAPWSGTWRLPAVGVGDMDGDGLADIAVGAPKSGKRDGGAVFIVRGKADGATVDLKRRDDVLFAIAGSQPCHAALGGEFVGQDLAAAGDVNGDGIGDLALLADGDCGEGVQSGHVYVVYGKRGGGDVDLRHLGAGGIAASGLDVLTPSLAGVGDVNGDGLADVLVGDLGYTVPEYAVVITGRRGGGAVDLRRLPRITSRQCWGIGYAAAAAGDVNGDGLADFALGAPDGCNDIQTRVFVVFGRRDLGRVNLDTLGSGGYSISGSPSFDAGKVLAPAGDVNGDGIPDLALGDPDASRGGRSYVGAVIVVYGKRGSDAVRLRSLGSGGFRWLGPETGGRFGFWLADLGDFNGDGRPDLIASIPARSEFAGGAWVLPQP